MSVAIGDPLVLTSVPVAPVVPLVPAYLASVREAVPVTVVVGGSGTPAGVRTVVVVWPAAPAAMAVAPVMPVTDIVDHFVDEHSRGDGGKDLPCVRSASRA